MGTRKRISEKTMLKSLKTRLMSKKCKSENEFENIQDRLNMLELQSKLYPESDNNKK